MPVVEAVKRLGLHVGVASFAASTSAELRVVADEYEDLTKALPESWKRMYSDRRYREGLRIAADARRAEMMREPGEA